ncbi:MAG: hypothetical protein JWM57_4271 [Phycisphaerales bacterium]|nr:hypothetical protein [Phycisphaerales bacterium]
MRIPGRLVWWKCLVWTILGGGVGLAIAILLPEPGIPANGTRLTNDRLVVALYAGNTADESINNLVLYPPHDGVRLIRFGYSVDGQSSAGYAFAGEPMLTEKELRDKVEFGRKYNARYTGAAAAYNERLSAAADAALSAIELRPSRQWRSAMECFDFLRAANPAFKYKQAWWTTDFYRFDLPVLAGAVAIGFAGSLLTRRTADEQAAADLLAGTRVTSAGAPVATQDRDLSDVDAFGNDLAARLAADAVDEDTHAYNLNGKGSPAGATKPLETLPVAAAPQAAQEKKDYAGEFYPTVRRGHPKAFSLIELLVVIGVIGILLAVLLPALIGARRSADTIACSANLRSIGQGMMLYLQQNRNTFPPAYLYIGHKIEGGVQTPTTVTAGYIHWSSYLYGTGAMGSGSVGQKAFLCPAMRQGGLPPTNTPPENRDPGQTCPTDVVVDQQAPRLAYSVNESLCPRNKFVAASFDSPRIYRFVKATEVANSSGTILAMEMIDNATAISYGNASQGWCMSHRPISGFVGLGGEVDMYLMEVGSKYRPTVAKDLDADPNSVYDATHTRLDLVGRNHGAKKGYPDRRLTNFLYVDGHCETKSVYDTVAPAFEWGEKFYSLVPNDDLVMP